MGIDNSYYYAHGHNANGPEWDGKEEPRLLSSTPIEVKVWIELLHGSISLRFMIEQKNIKPHAKPIDSYGWMDGKKLVKVFVEFENASSIEDEMIQLVDLFLPSTFQWFFVLGVDFILARLSGQHFRNISCLDTLSFEFFDWEC